MNKKSQSNSVKVFSIGGQEILEMLEKQAEKEHRSAKNMLEVMIVEYCKNRNEK